MADLIRVHALAIGSVATNSFERLRDIIAANVLPKGRGEDLRDAYEVIAMTRIRQQALALQADPGDLSTLDDPSALDEIRHALRRGPDAGN